MSETIRTVGDVDLATLVEDRSPRGIAGAVNRAIRGGRLRPGDRLPTVRDLARDLGVSPATVSEAWQALGSVGVIESRGRAGTFVREAPRDTQRPRRYVGIGGAPEAIGLDLSTGTPDPTLLPTLASGLARVSSRGVDLTTSYLDDPVLPSLGRLLFSSWPYEAERITVVDGALDALARVVDAVVRLGDAVLVENPGFPPLIDLLERVGAVVVPVEVDEQGVRPESLRDGLADDPVALFVQPRAQNPTGATWTRQRVDELVDVLRGEDVLVVEDDHSGLVCTGEDLTLGAWLPQTTVHIRSYSKSHGPDLRIAALGGPAAVVDRVVARRMLGPGWTSRLLQAVLVELLTDPAAVASVRSARDEYARRREGLRRALADRGVHAPAGDGVNVWVEVEDERSALVRLAALGVRVAPGAPFLSGPIDADHVRVTVGPLRTDGGPGDVRRVADLLAAAARPDGRPLTSRRLG